MIPARRQRRRLQRTPKASHLPAVPLSPGRGGKNPGFNPVTKLFLDNFGLPDYGRRAAAAVRGPQTENLELRQRF
jgi:hypothetical protein